MANVETVSGDSGPGVMSARGGPDVVRGTQGHVSPFLLWGEGEKRGPLRGLPLCSPLRPLIQKDGARVGRKGAVGEEARGGLPRDRFLGEGVCRAPALVAGPVSPFRPAVRRKLDFLADGGVNEGGKLGLKLLQVGPRRFG